MPESPPPYLLCRYLLERVVILLTAPLTLTVAAALALAIRLDSPGPTFFFQERVGYRRSTFRVVKYRTMYDEPAEQGHRLTAEGDPRITRVGCLLRPLHLDELPQLYNILRGEMSLIGPRPEPTWHVAACEERFPEYVDRRLMRPGLTGLAQVELPYVDSVDGAPAKLAYDLDYIDRYGPGLDARILVRTFTTIIKREGGR